MKNHVECPPPGLHSNATLPTKLKKIFGEMQERDRNKPKNWKVDDERKKGKNVSGNSAH
jgi:hypothetical protein